MIPVKVYHFSPYDTEDLARTEFEKLVSALSQIDRQGGVTVELFANPGVAGLEKAKYWVLYGASEYSDTANLRDRFNLDPGEAWDAMGSGGRWRNRMRCLSRKEFLPGKGAPSEQTSAEGGSDVPPYVYCLNCFASYKFNPEHAGKKAKCQKCGATVVIPTGDLSAAKGKSQIPELHSAVFNGKVEEVRRLLSEGADPDFSKDGTPPLWEATGHRNNMYDRCPENRIPIIKLLLSYGADPDARGDYGQTPLLSACVSGEVGIVRTLVAWCKDVNAIEPSDGWTPLHVTAGSGCIKREEDRQTIARLLISHGADLGARDRNGETPREVALRYKRIDLANLLQQSPRSESNDRRAGGQNPPQDNLVGVSLFSPSSQAPPPAVPPSWRTYTSSKYGFSFPYPPDWSILIEDKALEECGVPWTEGVAIAGGTPPDAYCGLHVSLRTIGALGAPWKLEDGREGRVARIEEIPPIVRGQVQARFHSPTMLEDRPMALAGLNGHLISYRHLGLKQLTSPLDTPVVEYSILLYGRDVTYNIIIECSEPLLQTFRRQLHVLLSHFRLTPLAGQAPAQANTSSPAASVAPAQLPAQAKGLLVFGPAAGECGRMLEGTGTQPATSPLARNLNPPARTLAPCLLTFAYYVPGYVKRQITPEAFNKWQDRFLQHLLLEKYGLTEIEGTVDGTSGLHAMIFNFDRISAEDCLLAAQTIEDAFVKCGGILPVPTAARPSAKAGLSGLHGEKKWWQFWR